MNNLHGFRVAHKTTTAGSVVENWPDLIPPRNPRFRQGAVAFHAALARAANKKGRLLSRLIYVFKTTSQYYSILMQLLIWGAGGGANE